MISFLRATTNNLRADFGFSIHTAFIHLWPSHGQPLAWVFILSLILLLGYEWSSAYTADIRRFYWAACLSLAAAPLLGFRTEMEHVAVLIIPLTLIFAVVHDRWRTFGSGLTTLLLLVLLASPWAFHLYASDSFGVTAQEITFLFLPLFTLIGLYWICWWAIRPPRIWSDMATR